MITKISVIVPVFNAEKTLERCVRSILNQSFKEFELILINDGSIDNSLEICVNYQKKDSRIRLINQENKGVSISRNVGLNEAKSKYIMFIDADDWIENNMFEQLLNNINSDRTELVMCGYKRIEFEANKPNFEAYVKPSTKLKIRKEQLYCELYKYFDNGLMNPLWNKLFKREIIENFQIRFNEALALGEDLLFNLEYLSKISTISIIDTPLYNYVVLNNGKSLSTKYNPKRLECQILMYTQIINTLKNSGKYNKSNKYYFKSAFSKAILGAIKNYLRNSNESNKEMHLFIKIICKDKRVIKNIYILKNGSLEKNLIALLLKLRAYNFLITMSKLIG